MALSQFSVKILVEFIRRGCECLSLKEFPLDPTVLLFYLSISQFRQFTTPAFEVWRTDFKRLIMFYFQKLEDSLYKAMKIGFSLNVLSFIDMIWLTYFINSTVCIATGMILNTYRLFIFGKQIILWFNSNVLRIIYAQKKFIICIYILDT